ncbi:MAG: hypothetical protein M9948_08960 [Lentimicrobium sp.]|nr:hypothetical protein [Lentimicrobium sp.]
MELDCHSLWYLDIEIDYINNEIITFGRGIYKANLCGISPLQGDITINGNEVWNGLKRIPGNITVKSGGKLTIFGTVKMNDNKGISC